MASLDVDAVKDAVKSLESYSVELLSDLVACDSRLHQPGEGEVQRVMEKALAASGFQKIEKVYIDKGALENRPGWSPTNWSYDGRYNVAAVFSPSSGQNEGKSLIINGHVDVVPIESNASEVWSNPPFTPVVKDGRLYGRGAGDMKGGIVCGLVALQALRKLGYEPASEVQFHSVLEEECSGNGCLSVLEAGFSKADGVLIPEPLPGIMSAQLGVMWLEIKIQGRPAHVLDTRKGVNAIEAGFALYGALKTLEELWNEPEYRHPMYKDSKHPINFNLGMINGGVWQSSVPANCTVGARVGFFPNQTLESVRQALEDTVSKAAEKIGLAPSDYKIEYNGFQAEGAVFADSASPSLPPLISTLLSSHRSITGSEATLSPATCTTDCRHYQLYYGIPATCYGPDASFIHGIDESVCLESMQRVACVYAMFIASWCGLRKIE